MFTIQINRKFTRLGIVKKKKNTIPIILLKSHYYNNSLQKYKNKL